jgi:hypothetical protein
MPNGMDKLYLMQKDRCVAQPVLNKPTKKLLPKF